MKSFLKSMVDTNELGNTRFEYKDKTIFLSDLGKITVSEFGLKDGDFILLSPRLKKLAKERAPLKQLHIDNYPSPKEERKVASQRTNRRRKLRFD